MTLNKEIAEGFLAGQLVTKISAIYGIRIFISASMTRATDSPNMNQNVAVLTFLLVFKMDVFIILSATSDHTPYPVLKIVCRNYRYSFFRRIHGERGNRCGNVWCCVMTAEIS
jgi:hypothetical protein